MLHLNSFRVLVCEVDAQLPLPALSSWEMQLLSFPLATRPFHCKIFNTLFQIKILETWEQNRVRSASVDFHNYANKAGRISIKVISWTTPYLASFYLKINPQLAAIPIGEHLQECKVIHTNTCNHTENLAPLPLLSWPSMHVCFTHLRRLMMECKVCAQWQTGVNSCRVWTKQATNISIIQTWFE